MYLWQNSYNDIIFSLTSNTSPTSALFLLTVVLLLEMGNPLIIYCRYLNLETKQTTLRRGNNIPFTIPVIVIFDYSQVLLYE